LFVDGTSPFPAVLPALPAWLFGFEDITAAVWDAVKHRVAVVRGDAFYSSSQVYW